MLNWLQSDRDVNTLIARKNYPRAIHLLQLELQKNAQSVHLRQQLADVWAKAGQPAKAIRILEELVDEFITEGFVAKAIAVLKKIQRIDPTRSGVDLQMASLLQQREEDAPAFRSPRLQESFEEGLLELSDSATLQPPEATSELRADWFEDAVDARRDFHWSPLLAGFDREELAALIGGLRLLIKKPGAIIYAEDEPGESMFILSSGKARVYRRTGTGRCQQTAVLHEGQFFGEGSVLTVSHRLSTVTAALECELLELDKEKFDQISTQHPRLRETIQNLYHQRASMETRGLDN
ncbi:MAG: cyclic nucleotide-binding domain-containing protein [Acidobacteriota bacterium]